MTRQSVWATASVMRLPRCARYDGNMSTSGFCFEDYLMGKMVSDNLYSNLRFAAGAIRTQTMAGSVKPLHIRSTTCPERKIHTTFQAHCPVKYLLPDYQIHLID